MTPPPHEKVVANGWQHHFWNGVKTHLTWHWIPSSHRKERIGLQRQEEGPHRQKKGTLPSIQRKRDRGALASAFSGIRLRLSVVTSNSPTLHFQRLSKHGRDRWTNIRPRHQQRAKRSSRVHEPLSDVPLDYFFRRLDFFCYSYPEKKRSHPTSRKRITNATLLKKETLSCSLLSSPSMSLHLAFMPMAGPSFLWNLLYFNHCISNHDGGEFGPKKCLHFRMISIESLERPPRGPRLRPWIPSEEGWHQASKRILNPKCYRRRGGDPRSGGTRATGP